MRFRILVTLNGSIIPRQEVLTLGRSHFVGGRSCPLQTRNVAENLLLGKVGKLASFRHYFSVCAILLALRSSSLINKADRLRRLPRASDAKIARDLNLGVS